MIMDNSHCSKCRKVIVSSEGPYCAACANEILEEYDITAVFTNLDTGKLEAAPVEDNDEFGKAIRQFILNVHKRMRDNELSHLN